MLYDLLRDKDFALLLRSHALDLLYMLLGKKVEFGVVADLSAVRFDPMIPSDVYEALPEFPLFLIVNYTFETAKLKEGALVFEAGFGPENVGSVVKIPVEAILQIVVEETPIFVNLTATLKQKPTPRNSMEVFLSNPENLKFLKKR